MNGKRRMASLAVLVISSMVLAACGGETPATPTVGSSAPSGGATVEPTKAAEPPAATDSNVARPAMKDPNTIVWADISSPQSLDPAWAYDAAGYSVFLNVYETLLFTKREDPAQFVPLLAAKMPEISSDGMTYNFQIRKGIKFHEGQDLTPEDVAYTFWRGLIQDRAGGPQWIMLQPLLGLDVGTFQGDVVDKQFNKDFKAGCEAAKKAVTFDNNAGTVTFHLKQPYGPMLQIFTGLWGSIVSKSWVASQGGWDGDCATAEKYHDPTADKDELFNKMNGTGPFKLDRYAPGEEVSLVRNDNYWLKEPLWEGGPTGPAKLQRAVLKIMPEFGTRFSALKAGDVDIAYVDRQYVSQVDPLVTEICEPGKDCTSANNPNGFLRLHKNLPSNSAQAIFFNQKVNTTGGTSRLGSAALDGNGIPPDFFSDIHIRRAFNYCFDWDTYINQVYNGEAEQALGPVISGELGYDASQAHFSMDLKKCEDEFKASTIKSADGKQVWDTGFKIDYVYTEGYDQGKAAGEILKEDLQRVNPKFRVELSSEPWPAFTGEFQGGGLPLYTVGWFEDYHDPHNWVVPYMASFGSFSASQGIPADLGKQIDDLIAQGIASTDRSAREKTYSQLQNIAYENALDLFLEQPKNRFYEQAWVKGWYYNPTYPSGTGVGVYFYVLSKGE